MRDRESQALWGALAILAVVLLFAYRNVDAAADALRWISHTQKVERQLDELSSAYSRAAAARRSYVVTGDASQLGELPGLDERLNVSVQTLAGLVADNPPQQERLATLASLQRERMTALDAQVERRRATGVGTETAEGLALTGRIRELREEMDAAENELLAQRQDRTGRDVQRTRVTIVTGAFAGFAILLLAFRRLRRSERALANANRFLDSIVENIPHMIFVKDAASLRFQRINRAGEELLGVKRAELLGKNDDDFFPPEQARFFQERDRETLSGKVIGILEEPIETRNGPRWLHTTKVPIPDDSGAPAYMLGISEDISEQREAAARLQAARDAALAANKELEAFSYSVAHDLRAPLRAIDGFSLALQEDCADSLGEEGRDHLNRVRTSAQQMALLIDGLLNLSRVTRTELRRQPVDLTELAHQCLAQLRAGNPAREVETVIQDGLKASGDARLLAAALENLLGNAWKFTGKQPAARIEIGKTGDGEAFFVRDNGAGFDRAYGHKLFDAFQRLHSATEFEGTGIGLATVQRIVVKHGGRIWADGEVGRGATFYFTLGRDEGMA